MLLHTALLAITVVQNTMVFLLCWEIMALSAFMLVLFEYSKAETVQAAINYLIQSHISLAVLMVGFIYVAYKTGSYQFSSMSGFSEKHSLLAGTALFLVFFVGFAIKAGFVPFHTWLPYAHPVAPAHVSGIMSGVVIKIGIFGILRMLLVIRTDYSTVGYIILFISLLSGLYGVMLAIIQHNLKRLLAYHSIENIGIIGIGIGVGCIGLGNNNALIAMLGFSGALLHTLNHSLFKSLLFYSAGNVYQLVHSVAIEQLGGLIKKMPHTALLFLVAALAICGIPPLNGFISEFLIYSGLYKGLKGLEVLPLMAISFTLLGLVLIGGLALLCFTKAFGIVFLGSMRHNCKHALHEVGSLQLIPMYMAALLIVLIGLFPALFFTILAEPVGLFSQGLIAQNLLVQNEVAQPLQSITLGALIVIGLSLLIAWLRSKISPVAKQAVATTWGCGYTGNAAKMQYTAGSFVRSYAKLAKPLLHIEKQEQDLEGVFPAPKHFETETYDKLEYYLIDKPILLLNRITGWFTFLQNGRLQLYILYGIVFIASIICIPFFMDKLMALLHFLNNI
jgi:formate hydrogenlyase subunit 3/multisubunit Na+/H+ antiporter MnhD subunit